MGSGRSQDLDTALKQAGKGGPPPEVIFARRAVFNAIREMECESAQKFELLSKRNENFPEGSHDGEITFPPGGQTIIITSEGVIILNPSDDGSIDCKPFIYNDPATRGPEDEVFQKVKGWLKDQFSESR